MDKRHRFSFPAVGGSSLLVIFAVLCLTVFALLGLSTVQAGQRLSNASAEAVESYYQADTRAEEILARLRCGEMPEGVTVWDDRYAYECPISETRSLQVEVRLNGEELELFAIGDCTALLQYRDGRWERIHKDDVDRFDDRLGNRSRDGESQRGSQQKGDQTDRSFIQATNQAHQGADQYEHGKNSR